MTRLHSKSLEVRTGTLALAILPFLVVGLSSWLLSRYGYPMGPLAEPSIPNGHAEAAARLKVLATFILMTAVGCTTLYYFVDGFRLFDRRSTRLLAVAFVVGALCGNALMMTEPFTRGDRLVGTSLTCKSLALIDGPAAGPAQAPDRREASAAQLGWARTGSDDCAAVKRGVLHWLGMLQRQFLALVVPALILGTISCLAMPGRPSRPACELQTQRLNVHLYLAAALMVSNLLFLAAVLRWPGYALRPSDLASFTGHVSSIVLYWGVVYSIFIAAFYVPVAIGLFGSYNETPALTAGEPETSSGTPEAVDVFRPLRLIATIAAPALLGLVGEVFRF